jgi:hypothetical protein
VWFLDGILPKFLEGKTFILFFDEILPEFSE